MKRELTPIEVVKELNYRLYNKQRLEQYQLFYYTDGFEETIKFGNEVLWNSDYDERDQDENDNYESLLVFVKRRLNKYINTINKLKLR